ncbi:MAG: hypothetical protein OXI81_08815 [Paracoccaceae bacterium]|nr:hypothetical protein [Paracoccaceae bacterium]
MGKEQSRKNAENCQNYTFPLSRRHIYRRLVDWEEVPGYAALVLQCFHGMDVGYSALILFGQALRSRLLSMAEAELLALGPEHWHGRHRFLRRCRR